MPGLSREGLAHGQMDICLNRKLEAEVASLRAEVERAELERNEKPQQEKPVQMDIHLNRELEAELASLKAELEKTQQEKQGPSKVSSCTVPSTNHQSHK